MTHKKLTLGDLGVKHGLHWDKAWMWLLEGMGIPKTMVERVWLCPCGMLWLRPVDAQPPITIRSE